MVSTKTLTSLFSALFITAASAQTTNLNLPSIGVGAGVLLYNGNIGNGSDVSALSRVQPGVSINFEQRFGNYFGISINGLYGQLSESERSLTSNLNFLSKIYQGDISFVLHLDGVWKNSACTPYFGIGAGGLNFNPYADLRAADGEKYYYWTDGTIRNEAQTPANIATAKMLLRDYVYETKLDSLNKYSHYTLIVPLTAGFNFKLSDHLAANLNATYFLTFTNNIDNVGKGKNDSYLYSSFNLVYTFGNRDKTETTKQYEQVDFNSIDDGDSDGDGVKDTKDKCPGTPKGVKVDSNGCPVDSDGDGIPDYLDKEPNSKKGAMVDANGVTLTDEMIAKKQIEWEGAANERSQSFNANPSKMTIEQIEKQAKELNKTKGSKDLPKEFQSADSDHDGFISASEINAVIDGFFSGENDFTVEKINRLIDYFFEQ